jgi:type II secretion system protein I
MRLHHTPGRSRPALTLLEVLVSLAIFLLSIGAISHLVNMSGERAIAIKRHSMAARLCQSKMAEVMMGAVPLQSQKDAAFDEDDDWQWSLDCSQSSLSTLLWTVTVTVKDKKNTNDGFEEVLTQMVLDPAQKGSTLDLSSSNSSSASSGTSGASSTSPSSSSSPSSTSSGTGK